MPLVTVSKYKISFEHSAVTVCFYLLHLKTVCFVLLSSSALSKPICVRQFKNCVCAKLRFINKVEAELEHLIPVEKSHFLVVSLKGGTQQLFSLICVLEVIQGKMIGCQKTDSTVRQQQQLSLSLHGEKMRGAGVCVCVCVCVLFFSSDALYVFIHR